MMKNDDDEPILTVTRPVPIEGTAYFIDYMEKYYIFEALW